MQILSPPPLSVLFYLCFPPFFPLPFLSLSSPLFCTPAPQLDVCMLNLKKSSAPVSLWTLLHLLMPLEYVLFSSALLTDHERDIQNILCINAQKACLWQIPNVWSQRRIVHPDTHTRRNEHQWRKSLCQRKFQIISLFTFATQTYWQSSANRCTVGNAERNYLHRYHKRFPSYVRNEHEFLLYLVKRMLKGQNLCKEEISKNWFEYYHRAK